MKYGNLIYIKLLNWYTIQRRSDIVHRAETTTLLLAIAAEYIQWKYLFSSQIKLC